MIPAERIRGHSSKPRLDNRVLYLAMIAAFIGVTLFAVYMFFLFNE
ncbi:MAG: hypothetical protein HOW73_26705 [Polyangiaceae bacterium]|nr:hypothetical protein [Polyangiaceae bacterium]